MAQTVVNAPQELIDKTQPPFRRSSRLALKRVAVVLLFLSAITWYIGGIGGNVRAVVPGRVYRSAQIAGSGFGPLTACWTGHSLDKVIQADGIKTVINLRGGTLRDPWYRDELAICKREDVDHIDISMSATHLPHPLQLARLLDTFDRARYPILYHCQGGSDRSGLVGTIYLNVYQSVPLDEAEHQQLTLRYGHFAFTRTGAMDRFFELYRQTGKGMSLRDWIMKEYPSLFARLPEKEKSGPPSAQEYSPITKPDTLSSSGVSDPMRPASQTLGIAPKMDGSGNVIKTGGTR